MPQMCAKPQTRVDAVERLELVELDAVDDARDDLVHVVGRADVLGDDAVELLGVELAAGAARAARRPPRLRGCSVETMSRTIVSACSSFSAR